MNVLFYTLATVNPLSGGIERVSFNLCESFMRRGISVYFICRKGKADDTHFIIPSSDIVDPCNFINSIIEKLNIDIIIDQYGWSSVISHKTIKPEVKIIRCLHTDVEERSITRRLLGYIGRGPFKQSFMSFLFWLNTPFRRERFYRGLKKTLLDIDRLIVLSPSYIERLHHRGIISDKIEAIPNGVPIAHYDSTGKKNTIVFCGRIINNPKNVFFLIDLWSQLQKHSDWEFVIIGGGEDLARIKSLAKRRHLSNISFPGYTDPAKYYSAAKIFLLPSFSEGFPMVLLESMTYGCVPIVYDSCSSFKEIIDDGSSGVIVKPFNKLVYLKKCEYLMTHPDVLAMMSANAKAKVDSLYSLDRITDRWVELFNRLTQEGLSCTKRPF